MGCYYLSSFRWLNWGNSYVESTFSLSFFSFNVFSELGVTSLHWYSFPMQAIRRVGLCDLLYQLHMAVLYKPCKRLCRAWGCLLKHCPLTYNEQPDVKKDYKGSPNDENPAVIWTLSAQANGKVYAIPMTWLAVTIFSVIDDIQIYYIMPNNTTTSNPQVSNPQPHQWQREKREYH